ARVAPSSRRRRGVASGRPAPGPPGPPEGVAFAPAWGSDSATAGRPPGDPQRGGPQRPEEDEQDVAKPLAAEPDLERPTARPEGHRPSERPLRRPGPPAGQEPPRPVELL